MEERTFQIRYLGTTWEVAYRRADSDRDFYVVRVRNATLPMFRIKGEYSPGCCFEPADDVVALTTTDEETEFFELLDHELGKRI